MGLVEEIRCGIAEGMINRIRYHRFGPGMMNYFSCRRLCGSIGLNYRGGGVLNNLGIAFYTNKKYYEE